MGIKIRLYFKRDLGRPQFVPHYIFHAVDAVSIFECVAKHTGDEDLAVTVANWADNAHIKDVLDTDAVHAEAIKR